ncbi:MAG TPA: polysaccharide deacetylase family protein [Ureibacillus sp.]|nr:polysaccharide deacetylase family protein [Ureibacillus sp.]
MKKAKKVLLTFITFSIIFGSIITKTEASTISYAVPLHDDVIVYDNRTGALLPIATIKMNQPFIINSDFGVNWWQVKIGNGYGYINKKDVYRSVTWTTNNVNQNRKNTNSTVWTQVDTPVYDNTSGSLVPMGVIKKGVRYPIIADFGKNWWTVDIGGRIGYMAKYNVGWDYGIPVLMYHHILKPEEKQNSQFANANTTVTTVEFEEQMKWLYDNGFQTITMRDLERYLDKSVNLPAKSVVITFDDGIISTREYAYPVLKNYGFEAEQFIITSRIPTTPVTFDWQGLQFFSNEDMMNLDDVFNYGSHTHALHNIFNGRSQVLLVSDSVVTSDIKISKDILKTNYFAYPFGQYNSKTINILKSLGFTMAVTTKNGKVHLGDDKLQLNRLGIEPGMSINQFAKDVGK